MKNQASKDLFRINKYKLVDFSIQDGKKHKVAIIVPGGGYSCVCSFVEGTPIAKKLNEKGISCFVLYYRVRKKAKFPNPQDDLARAIKELIDKADALHIDMSNYSIWGSSAGGHLVATFGTDVVGYSKYNLPKPRMIELTYPVISLEQAITHDGTRKNILGKDISKEELLSVDKQVTTNYPSTFIWCGNSDKTVPPENSHRMVKALQSNAINHVFYEFEDVDHGVGVGDGTNAYGWIDKVLAFWDTL